MIEDIVDIAILVIENVIVCWLLHYPLGELRNIVNSMEKKDEK